MVARMHMPVMKYVIGLRLAADVRRNHMARPWLLCGKYIFFKAAKARYQEKHPTPLLTSHRKDRMSFCKDCISGVTHEGTAEGKWENIGGVQSYVATPTKDYPKDKIILFLTDVFGPQFINARLLADDFARNGFKVIVPDILNGDPIPPELLGTPGFDFSEWHSRHLAEQTRPPIDKVLAALEEQGVKWIGSTGFCFGARYVFDLAFEGKIKAAVVSHPSFLKPSEDFEKFSKTGVPLLMNTNPNDPQLSDEGCKIADNILGNDKFAPGYKRVHWEGCPHGFAV